MEKRIELEKRGRQSNQITELNLDNCRSTNIVGLTDEFTALESLSLINVGLTSLKNFPKLTNLKKLELSDNRISNGLSNLSTSTKLTNLNLSGNKIKELEELKPLESFKNLQVLDLFNNEATSIEGYRQKIFAMIPSLVYLDGFDAYDNEAISDGDEEDELNGNDSDEDGNDDYTKPFCINGMEIDLGELELYEQKLCEKRQNSDQQNTASAERSSQHNELSKNDQIDELDEYLDRLTIEIKQREQKDSAAMHTTPSAAITSVTKSNPGSMNSSQLNCNNSNKRTDDGQTKCIDLKSPQTSLPMLLYTLMGLLVFVNSVHFSDGCDDDAEDDGDEYDEEEDEEDDENGDVSLAEVYNDDLEEDNSDYVEEVEGEDDDSDIEDEEDEGTEKPAGEPQPAAEESPARGTKRKHDDDGNDG